MVIIIIIDIRVRTRTRANIIRTHVYENSERKVFKYVDPREM